VDSSLRLLPGQRVSPTGRLGLDLRAVAALSLPFMLNSAIQAVLNATDRCFVGRLAPPATSAVGAVYWPVLVLILLFGGVSLSVQTLVAQGYGSRRYVRAGAATWIALWAALAVVPVFTALAFGGRAIFTPFGIPAGTLTLALEYWFPRILTAPFGIALYGVLGFFNGIGRPGVTLRITVAVAALNALLNQVLIFDLGLGVAGSAWATGAAQLAGLLAGLACFLSGTSARRFRSHLTYRLRLKRLRRQFSLGFPMGLLSAADILGFSLFQLMQVRLGNVDGASTQIVLMLTSFCYMPTVGIAMAGTTLVGQSIGARSRDWAYKLGNGIILISILYMGLVGVVVAAAGPWLMPWFTNAADPDAAAVAAKGCVLLWIAAGYQLFDGFNISCGACLRGAGDVRIPSLMVLALSWFFFVPLAHSLTFKPGAGWVSWLPQFGWGAVGGWTAALVYICCLGVMLYARWRSGAWRAVVLT
jgi:multidrug resistance protein, MATE family